MAALVLLLGHVALAAEPCEPAMARLVSVQGMVELKRSDTDLWQPARLDAELCAGDSLRVGPLGRAALAFANDSVLRLDERTTLRLSGPAEPERSLIELVLGAVHFFSHRPRALQVETPFVNAGAEGTEFLVRVAEDRTEIIVFDGRVLARNAKGELGLVSSQAALVRAGEAPRQVIVARPRDAVAWALYYPPILSALAEGRAEALATPLQRATAAVAANDYAGAIAALDEAPEAARDAHYYVYRAGVLLNVGRVDEARAAIDRALALDPAAGDALAQRAVIEVVQNRREEALADARRAVELGPGSSAARIALSYALQASFQLEEARETLREAALRNPEDALAWARLAELEQSFGDLDAAQRAADRAVALAPDLARTQMVLGFAALTRIDIDTAKAAFLRAIALDSANPLPRLGLGLAEIRRGGLEEGRREIEIAAALDSNNSLIRSYLGKAYFDERRDPQAADQLQIAKQLDPNDPTPWLYDAIRKQTENRPGEALQDLQKSIELNDNRAVYRSRLLLDSDRASRGTSLARIYDDLGFLQPGINEASKSLTLDPSNAGAHRFLSDVYVGVRRREISRVSNLLQAQMLQDININPVQPSLSEANLNIVTQGGPARPGFNEFTPLFERNQAQLNASGVVGNNATLGGEAVASGVQDRFSVSAGAFHYETDGWRANNDIQHNIYNVFFQAEITPELNAQAELRHRKSEEGDLAFDFDPDFFSTGLERDFDQNTERLGLRYSPTPNSDVLLSYIHGNLDDNLEDSFDEISTLTRTEDQGNQAEGQYLYRLNRLNLTTGFGASDVDRTFHDDDGQGGLVDNKQQITHYRGYMYGNLNLPEPTTWTVGVSYDDFQHNALKIENVNPKFGVQWNVTEDLVLRGAVFRVLKPALINNQLLEPTQIAGFNQFFDDANGDASWRYGVGLDQRLTEDLFVGAEATWREVSNTILNLEAQAKRFENSDEQTHRAYLHWLPIPELALSAEFIYDRFTAQKGTNLTENFGVPEHLETFSVPLGVRYFHPSGLFAGVGATYVHQDVERAELAGPQGSDDFFVVDAAVGYRLPKRFGIVSLSIANLFDKKFKYQDDSFREFQDQPSIGPYIPDQQILARVTLNW